MPIHLTCQNCGKAYTRKPKLAAKSKACCRRCQADLQKIERKGMVLTPHSPILWKDGAENPNWKGGVSEVIWRKQLGNACERCKSKRHLVVHHKDEDKRHNDPENLETLCKACHQAHHCVRDPATGQYVERTA